MADKRQITAGFALASVEINGRESPVETLVFNISEPVIGAFTLEALGLGLDPVSGELKSTRDFIIRA